MDNSFTNFINGNKTNTSKSEFDPNSWIAYDLEWSVTPNQNDNISDLNKHANYGLDKNASGTSKPPALQEYREILTFAFEDNLGNKGCFDLSEYEVTNSFLEAIKGKVLQYKYCFAWGSKAVVRKNPKTGELEGINGDLAILDSNFRANGIPSIVRYNEFSGMPFIKKDFYVNNYKLVSDIDLLKVFAKPPVKTNILKNKYKSLRLGEVGQSLLIYGKLDNKSGAKLDEMSVEERKSYCLQDAHVVAELVRIRNGDILKMMQTIAFHTGLTFEEVCHKGMIGIWKKILNNEIQKRIRIVGYNRVPKILREIYSNNSSYSEVVDICDNEEEDEDEISEYKENSYEQFIELREQKFKERMSNDAIYYCSNSTQPTSKEKYSHIVKQGGKSKFKGAIVLEPNRGLHYNVCAFDVTSLYPTIIINYNISPEKVNCSCCKNNPKAKIALDKDIQNDLKYVTDKVEGYWACQLKRGLFSKKLKELTETRIRYKNEGKELESTAIKAIINSGYGVFRNIHFKYYDPKCAELITAIGRQTQLEMRRIANEMGFTVLYGDTDSLFVNNIKDNEDIRKFIDTCKRKLNVEVSHEKTLRKLILVGKKHYVGFPNDHTKEPIIKGMEGINQTDRSLSKPYLER